MLNKLLSHFAFLLVGFAGALLLLQSNCSGLGDSQKVDTFTQVKYKDFKIELKYDWGDFLPDTVHTSYPVYKDTTEFDTTQFLANLDTGELVEDYFKRRYYSRELSDSNFTASIKAQVWRNRLDSLKLDYTLEYQTKEVTKTVHDRSPKIIGTFTAGIDYYEPAILYQTQDGWIFGTGYEIGQNFKNGFRIKVGKSF